MSPIHGDESMAWGLATRFGLLPKKSLFVAAIHRYDSACRPRASLVARQPAYCFGTIVGGDDSAQERALPIVLDEFVRLNSKRLRRLFLPGVRPNARAHDHSVGIDRVAANALLGVVQSRAPH